MLQCAIVLSTLAAQKSGAVTRLIQEAPMWFFAQALALLPAAAALALTVLALADHRDTAHLNSLRDLSFAIAELEPPDDLEISAA